jgi:hypothetical protein
MAGSRHWLAVLVNTCIAVAPMACALGNAEATPPAVDV